MQEIIKDSTIKLFGKKIPFDLEVAWTMSDDDEDVIKETEDNETEQHQGRSSPEDFESSDPSVSPESGNPKTPSIDEETVKPKDSDKTILKKPDKILPCPRCKSMDTKFCYYNNYNVNQPRHFCKSCQRYWTSGGTMRNVPVGAGRRKSKSSASVTAAGYPQICISDSQLHHHHQYPNSRNQATVLSFSSDSKTQGTLAMNDSSSESTVTTTMSANRNEELISHHNTNLHHHHQIINGYGVPPPPWPYNMAAVPFYPFWTCHVPTPWNLPWPAPQYPCSEKRSREGDDYSEQERPKNKVIAPKTLRMDDPNEAAKSSIWATLGIKKNDGVTPSKGKGGFFKGFEKTLEEGENNPSILCANPAAFSRSLNFHERH